MREYPLPITLPDFGASRFDAERQRDALESGSKRFNFRIIDPAVELLPSRREEEFNIGAAAVTPLPMQPQRLYQQAESRRGLAAVG